MLQVARLDAKDAQRCLTVTEQGSSKIKRKQNRPVPGSRESYKLTFRIGCLHAPRGGLMGALQSAASVAP